MYTALRATSLTMSHLLTQQLENDTNLRAFFSASAGGNMVVTLNTPQEMGQAGQEGLSVWLYRIERDEQRLNDPPRRVAFDRERRTPLPLRLHYLVAPIVDTNEVNGSGAELEQAILGKVLQTFYDYPKLRGTDLRDDFAGTTVELSVRLEPQGLEEITRVWDALDRSYQLCLSYEVSVVCIESAREEVDLAPVEVVIPEFGVITASGGGA